MLVGVVCVCPNGPLGGFTQSQEGGQGGWRERRKCIFDLIRARVCRAKAQRSREVIQGALTCELPHLGSSVQTHPCLPLCRNLTNVFLSLACVVLLGKTEDLVLVPCSSNVLCWFSVAWWWTGDRNKLGYEQDRTLLEKLTVIMALVPLLLDLKVPQRVYPPV